MTPRFPLAGKRVFVAGHRGLVGAGLCRRLEAEDCDILTATRAELDLTQQAATQAFLADTHPDVVVVAAAKVGGIGANLAAPAEFIHENLAIATNLIHGAHRANVGRLLFLGSSCMYPRAAAQPMTEEALLTGTPEPTNAPYALAKLAGAQMAQTYRRQYGRAYITAIPCNLYGPGDRFDAQASHVIPALMVKARAALTSGADMLTLWGTGRPLREFLHVDDLADALVFLLKRYDADAPINIGSNGREVTIDWLAREIARISGFSGKIIFDSAHPDGGPRKLMDCKRMVAMGWSPRISLEGGLESTWRWFLCNTHE